MKIISIAHPGSTDFGFAIVNDDDARAFYAKCERANHQGRYSLAMFSPDAPKDFLFYIQDENDTQKADMEKDKV